MTTVEEIDTVLSPGLLSPACTTNVTVTTQCHTPRAANEHSWSDGAAITAGTMISSVWQGSSWRLSADEALAVNSVKEHQCHVPWAWDLM